MDITPVTNQPTQNLFGPADQGTLGKEDFLRLLVTQLRNQDPINPVKGEDFAAQLAQFSSVEQLQNINANLENNLEMDLLLNQALNNTLATTLIGNNVKAIGGKRQCHGINGLSQLDLFDVDPNSVPLNSENLV